MAQLAPKRCKTWKSSKERVKVGDNKRANKFPTISLRERMTYPFFLQRKANSFFRRIVSVFHQMQSSLYSCDSFQKEASQSKYCIFITAEFK